MCFVKDRNAWKYKCKVWFMGKELFPGSRWNEWLRFGLQLHLVTTHVSVLAGPQASTGRMCEHPWYSGSARPEVVQEEWWRVVSENTVLPRGCLGGLCPGNRRQSRPGWPKVLADCLELGQLPASFLVPGQLSASPAGCFWSHRPCAVSRKPLCPPPRASTAPTWSGQPCTPWPSCCLSCSLDVSSLIAHATPIVIFCFLCPVSFFQWMWISHCVCWLTDGSCLDPGQWVLRLRCAGQTFSLTCPQPWWVQGLGQSGAWDF